MKRPDGVFVIAAYEFICGFLSLCVGYIALWIAALGGATSSQPWWPIFFWGLVGVGSLVLGAIAVLTGIGLLRMRQWARWVAVALALLALPAFPIGTVIGIVIIWYLLSNGVGEQFRSGTI